MTETTAILMGTTLLVALAIVTFRIGMEKGNTFLFILSHASIISNIVYAATQTFEDTLLHFFGVFFTMFYFVGFFYFFTPSRSFLMCPREDASVLYLILVWPFIVAGYALVGCFLFATKFLAVPALSDWFLSTWQHGKQPRLASDQVLLAPFNEMMVSELLLECVPQVCVQILNIHDNTIGIYALISIFISTAELCAHVGFFKYQMWDLNQHYTQVHTLFGFRERDRLAPSQDSADDLAPLEEVSDNEAENSV